MTVTRRNRAQRSRIITLEQVCALRGSSGVRNMSPPGKILEERSLRPDDAIPLNTFDVELENSKKTYEIWVIVIVGNG